MSQPMDHVSHVPFCPEKGFSAGMNEKARDGYARACLAQSQADEDWLGEDRPFIPRDLDRFRSSQCVITLGDYLSNK